jgi:uracil-DNA glycosylase
MTKEITTKAQFLCNLCDCISISNKGDPLVKMVFEKFPYANCYIERVAAMTRKSVAGTIQIKGDNKKNRYVINMFTQFYPGNSKGYPNDNLLLRLGWFRECLEKLLDMPETVSLAFPKDIGTYQTQDYRQRYLSIIDDFRKKFYLKNHRIIKIVDYSDNDLLEIPDQQKVNYDEPINIVRMTDDFDTGIDPATTPISKPKFKIIKHINLDKLVYVTQTSVSTQPSISTSVPIPEPTTLPTKIKVGLKKIDKPIDTPKVNTVVDVKETNTEVKETVIENVETMEKFKKVVDENEDTVEETMEEIKKTSEEVKESSEEVKKTSEEVGKTTEDVNEIIEDVNEIIVDVNEIIEDVTQPSSPVYEKNPTWKRKISELVEDLDQSWDVIFKDPKIIGLLSQLDHEFEKEMSIFGDAVEILPIPQDNIFNAFKHCVYPPKVLVVGQDCYPNPQDAMGLSFSVPDGIKIPPSLVNIFRELSTDIKGFKTPKSGNLTKWAQQGVLLMNCALTVRRGQKESHMKLWKPLTDALIHLISEKSPNGLVFMLWGGFAKGKKDLIKNQSKHLILESTHPSPLGANQGGWFDCKHFSKCNDFLTKKKMIPIDWSL